MVFFQRQCWKDAQKVFTIAIHRGEAQWVTTHNVRMAGILNDRNREVGGKLGKSGGRETNVNKELKNWILGHSWYRTNTIQPLSRKGWKLPAKLQRIHAQENWRDWKRYSHTHINCSNICDNQDKETVSYRCLWIDYE